MERTKQISGVEFEKILDILEVPEKDRSEWYDGITIVWEDDSDEEVGAWWNVYRNRRTDNQLVVEEGR